MADYRKQANDLILKFREDMRGIERRYADPGVSLPGEYTVAPADSNEDALRQQQEAHSLEMEKTHRIDPATGQWVPIQQPYSRQGFRSSANENYWLNQAKKAGLNVNSIDDIIAIQKSLGVTADGKWGNASIAAYKAKNQSKQPTQQKSTSQRREVSVNPDYYNPNFLPGTYPLHIPVDSGQKPKTQPKQQPQQQSQRQQPTKDRRAGAVGTPQQRAGGNPIRGVSNWQNGPIHDAVVSMGNGIANGFKGFVNWLDRSAANNPNNTNRSINPNGYQRFQQGGAMQAPAQDEQQAFVQYIAQIFGVKSQQDLKKVIQQLGEEGMKQLQAAFKQGVSPEQIRNQMGSNNQAQFARNGARICPDGTRLVFKTGGCMCQKMQDGGTTKKRFTSKPPIKKKGVNANDTIHVNGKPYDISGGKTKYPPLTKEGYRKLPASKKVDVDLKDQASGRSVPSRRFGGVIQRFKNGGQMGGEFQDGIGMRSFADQIVGRPKMKCGGKTKKRLVPKKK